ncbi:PGAP1-domain-containing protein, partial [Serendipita vermifera]
MFGMGGRLLVPLLALLASFFMYYFSYLANYSPLVVSPQGCEMSWMSPHYVLHSQFNTSWTPLASRYSLWLYRERGLDHRFELRGLPVLFIPGNAGSSRQVRSVASSAARQFFQEEHGASMSKPLDFFTVEFNEDFSAIHPPTLLSQTEYSRQAVRYILSLYPKGTRVILLGHSMGGTVSQLLLSEMDDVDIRAVFTMSTPNLLAPVRFDRRSEDIYTQAQKAQRGEINSIAPLISVCGGSTDSQITSELCTLPTSNQPLRRTIATSALQGAWTGVGHREMVWCHQIRYLVAQAMLALANDPSSNASIDHILRTHPTSVSPSKGPINVEGVPLHYIRDGVRLEVARLDSGLHLIPTPSRKNIRLTLFASGVLVNEFPPNHKHGPNAASLRILYCSRPHPTATEPKCVELAGAGTLIPKQKWPDPFPASKGVNGDDHITMFEATLNIRPGALDDSVGVWIERPGSTGWIVAAIEDEIQTTSYATIMDAIKWSGFQFTRPTWSKSLHTTFHLPSLLFHSLIVYRGEVTYDGNCRDPKLPPLIHHEPSDDESHYHSVSVPFYLHSHKQGPFIQSRGLIGHHSHSALHVYSSGECGIQVITLHIAWQETLGRLGVRYWMGLAMWSVAVVGILQTFAWYRYDSDGVFPSAQSLTLEFVASWMSLLGGLLIALCLIPLPKTFLLGNEGEPLLALLAFPMWLFAAGLVCASEYVLTVITSLIRFVQRLLRIQGSHEERKTSKRWIASILLVVLLVAIVIPFQVALMIVFLIQFSLCSTPEPEASSKTENQKPGSSPTPERWRQQANKQAANFHILLLLTWLLPFAAPILVVWIRTLQTAGYTVPFNGDHNI